MPIGSESAHASTPPLSIARPRSAGREARATRSCVAVDAVRAQHAVGEDERRRAHAGNADRFAAAESSTVWMLPFDGRLHAQAAAVDAAGELHVHPLLDRLQENTSRGGA